MVPFGGKLRALRREKRLTQAQAAGYLGVTKAMVSAYEVDIRSPSYDVLIKIARLYQVSVDYLLGTERPVPANLDLTGLTGHQIELVNELIHELRKVASES